MKVFVEYYERSIIENSLLIENFYPKSLSPVHISGTEVFYLRLHLTKYFFYSILEQRLHAIGIYATKNNAP